MMSAQEKPSDILSTNKGPIIDFKQDFASFSAGASIIEHLTSPTWSYHREIQPSEFPFYKSKQK
ncbi:hypothetical protein, partial [Salmonella sp. s44703]|uniref:hypothetical protein n=1 Tax=Salmonella sp. s44703 TaxID=3159646 RepID=UPI00397ED329